MILSTDIAKHFEHVGLLRAKLNANTETNLSDQEERVFLMKVLIKCADIGHAAKTKNLHEKWSAKVCEEFFNQGDEEKKLGLPVSMNFDRETTEIAKSQAGFLQNLVIPLWESANAYLNSEKVEK